jgi:hypothetical protein
VTKALLVLCTLQTIGIVILLLHIFGDEHAPAATVHATNPAAVSSSPFASTSAAPLADEDRLRMIIREELAAQRTVQSTGATPPPVAARDEESNRVLQERVAQQIEAYQASGSITDAQMQELHVQIAQLDAAGRKRMMSKLIRAMNAGDIKGRL